MGASNKSYDSLGGVAKLQAGPIELLNEEQLRRLEWWVKNRGYCSREVSIIQLSARIGTNRTKMSNFINGVYHMSFRNWINSMRCAEAQRQWSHNPHILVDAMASKCGFTARKYFDHVFMDHVGVSPAAYRRSLCTDHPAEQGASPDAPVAPPMGGGKLLILSIENNRKALKKSFFR